MTPTPAICDVFLVANGPKDRMAQFVKERCEQFGLTTASDWSLENAERGLESAVLEALGECEAVVVLLDGSNLRPTMLFEVGAAFGLNKPIYPVIENLGIRIPSSLARYRAVLLESIDDVLRVVSRATKGFTESDNEALIEAYATVDATVDALFRRPSDVAKLLAEFNTRADKRPSGDRLLSQLMRLRKQGRLAAKKRGAATSA